MCIRDRAQGERIVEVLKQNRSHPIAVEDQVCIFYAVTRGFLKDVEVTDVAEYEDCLLYTSRCV